MQEPDVSSARDRSFRGVKGPSSLRALFNAARTANSGRATLEKAASTWPENDRSSPLASLPLPFPSRPLPPTPPHLGSGEQLDVTTYTCATHIPPFVSAHHPLSSRRSQLAMCRGDDVTGHREIAATFSPRESWRRDRRRRRAYQIGL